MTLFWIALAVALILPLACAVLVVARGIALYRAAKGTFGRIGSELAKLERASAAMDENMRLAAEASARLNEASTRLGVSRARLQVQLDAVREARDSLGVLSLLLK